MRRLLMSTGVGVLAAALTAGPALACGGLLGPDGAVNLLRTSTLAAYHDGVEHYVTAFEFAGGGARFGSIIPLPDVPTNVRKGGDWTLQRLAIETQPPQPVAELAFRNKAALGDSVEVLEKVRIDALNVTILEGGGDAVGRWAKEHGFNLPPDTPEVLDFYAERSPIFMAAAFDAKAARNRGFGTGDATPVHLTIPTDDPWVPLRILGLGKQSSERIEADVYLLTDGAPALLPAPSGERGLEVEASRGASDDLLRDLRSDRGMDWLPKSDMHLTYLTIDARAGALSYDLAIDASGLAAPSRLDAGLEDPGLPPTETPAWLPWLAAAAFGAAVLWGTNRLAGAGS
ncbi:MAG: DUF2330 domain-containing protein [Actinomycetota bacterium]